MLEFNIRNQEISRIDSFSPAEKSVGYLVAKFNFKTDDWNGASKIAVFKNLKTKEEYDRKLEEDACIVPSEALSEKGQFEVSVYGLKDGQKITSNVATCNLNRTLSGGSMTEDDSLNAAEKLLLEAQNKLDKSGHAPNKLLGTDEKGNVVTKEQEEFNLEVAGEDKLGGVKPLNKTDDMTLEVGVDKDGRLFAKGKDITVDSKLDEESQNPVQNKVLTKEVNTLKEHNTQLKETIEKLQIKVTTEKASFHNIKDSANMKVVDFGMEGKTEQKSTEGNQLFDISKIELTNTGTIDITEVGKDYIVITSYDGYSGNGLIGTGKTLKELCPLLEVGETYLLTATTDSTDNARIYVGVTWAFGKTMVMTEEALNSQVILYGHNHTTTSTIGSCKISNVQIQKGTAELPLEPYTNGPSPNPDYPQEIVNAGVYNEETGRYEHKFTVGNKNWFDISQEATPVGGNRDIPVNLVFGETYILSAAIISSGGIIALRGFTSESDTAGDQLIVLRTGTNTSGAISGSVTVEKVYHHCAIRLYGNALASFDDIQLEIDAPTDFTEHQSQQITLTSPVPLTKWDYLTKRDGVYGWSVWDGEYLFTSTKNIAVDNANDKYIRAWVSSEGLCQDCLCDRLRFGGETISSAKYKNMFYISSSYIYMFITNSILEPYGYVYNSESSDNKTNAKEALIKMLEDVGGFNFIGKTAEEVAFHPLPDEEQELLNNLETYYGVTNLYNDQGCPTWLTYIADPKLYLDNQLLEIKSAIV